MAAAKFFQDQKLTGTVNQFKAFSVYEDGCGDENVQPPTCSKEDEVDEANCTAHSLTNLSVMR